MASAKASNVFAGLLVCILAFSFNASTLQAQTTGRTPLPSSDPGSLIDSGVIVDVRFEGNEELSDYELRTIVASRPAEGVKKWIGKIIPSLGTPEQYADRAVLEGDVHSIEEYYKNNGFLEADVEVEQRFDSTDLVRWLEVFNRNRVTVRQNRVPLPRVRDTIVFWIDEGPPYTISGVSFVGLESLPEEFQPELTERNTIRIGERWSSAVAEAEALRLRGILQENGYPFFKRDSIVAEGLGLSKQVRVIPYLNPGNRYRFGGIRIVYDSSRKGRVSDRVVLGQLVDIDSGNWYKESTVRLAEQYLYRLNVFEFASITLDTTAVKDIPPHLRDSMALPVLIRLRMKSTQEIVPGAYLGFGSGRADVFAGISTSYINSNIFGGAQRLNLDLFYQFLPGWQPRMSAALTLLFPYLGWRNFPLSIGLSYTDTKQYPEEGNSDEPDYIEENIRARVSSNILIGGLDSRTSISPEITAERVNEKTPPDERTSGVLRKQLNTIVAGYGQWDRANDIFNPTQGFILNGGSEVAVPGLDLVFAPEGFSSARYWKGILQGRVYTDLGSDGIFVVASKARYGTISLFEPNDPLRDPPRERLFFGGGSASNRGWNSQELLVSNSGKKTADGGYRSLETSLEFRMAPFKNAVDEDEGPSTLAPLRVALFTDAGNVWDHNVPIASKNVAWTVGIGFRYDIFIGPIRVDWGLKLYDPNPELHSTERSAGRSDTQGRWIFDRKFFLDDIWTWHFGIGQAF